MLPGYKFRRRQFIARMEQWSARLFHMQEIVRVGFEDSLPTTNGETHMKKLISVTEEHIKKGEPSMCHFCPIAWAIGLTCKPFLFKEVREDFVVVTNTEERVRLPRSAQRFIHRFDSGKPVKPFRFYLDVPE